MKTATALDAARGVEMPERTMIRIDKSLIKQIKVRAAQEDVSIIDWVDQALHEALKSKQSKERKK